MEIIGKVAEGGQTWAHRVKMISQVLKSAFIWAFLAGLMTIGYLQYQAPKSSYQALYYWSKAKLFSNKKTIQVDPSTWKALKQGSKQGVLFAAMSIDDFDRPSSKLLIRRELLLQVCEKKVLSLLERFLTNIKKAGYFATGTFGLALLYFFFRGKHSRKKKHLSGIRLESTRKLKYRLIFSRKASDLRIGALPLLKGSESQHIAILGSPNVGKTNCLRGLLRQLRKRGDRVIILDIVGDFVSEFYREGKDHLLNPYDARSH
ncbi:MAG: type IV secretion system DNA-binding domain-containing protein [Chlamydiota bacterium]